MADDDVQVRIGVSGLTTESEPMFYQATHEEGVELLGFMSRDGDNASIGVAIGNDCLAELWSGSCDHRPGWRTRD